MKTSDTDLNGSVDPSTLSEREWKALKAAYDQFLRKPGEDVEEAFRALKEAR